MFLSNKKIRKYFSTLNNRSSARFNYGAFVMYIGISTNLLPVSIFILHCTCLLWVLFCYMYIQVPFYLFGITESSFLFDKVPHGDDHQVGDETEHVDTQDEDHHLGGLGLLLDLGRSGRVKTVELLPGLLKYPDVEDEANEES